MYFQLKLIDFDFAKKHDNAIFSTYHCMATEILKFAFNKKQDPDGIDSVIQDILINVTFIVMEFYYMS